MFLANAMPSENIYSTTLRLSPIISEITYLALFRRFDIIARKNATFSKAAISFLHNNYYMHIELDNHSFLAQLVR